MRIEGLEQQQAHWLMRPFYWAMKRRFGKPLTPFKVQAHRPAGVFGVAIVNEAIEAWSKAVDVRFKRMACLRAAQLIGCPF
jgi:hypothetical protein